MDREDQYREFSYIAVNGDEGKIAHSQASSNVKEAEKHNLGTRIRN